MSRIPIDPRTGKPFAFIPTEDIKAPPASRPPGVSGMPPLPPGRPVAMARNATGQQSWTAVNVPASLQPQLRATQQAVADEIAVGARQPPVDPAQPPVHMNVVDINQLPPEQQAQYMQNIQQAMNGQPATAQSQPAKPQPAPKSVSPRYAKVQARLPQQQPPAADPITAYENPRQMTQQEALDQFLKTGQTVMAAAPMNEAAQTVARSPQVKVDYGAPERPATNYIPDPNYRPPAQEESPVPDPQKAAQEIRTESPIAPITECPHCRWQLSMPDPPEPPYGEKMAYLQAMSGDKPYVRRIDLLGGHMTVAFRVLSTAEIDECFAQAKRDAAAKKADNYSEYLEKVNRYRLYLQLLEVKTQTYTHNLPDGLTRELQPAAASCWDFSEQGPIDEPLLAVEQWMLANVLKNETIFRVLYNACGNFNKLVDKLEAMVDTETDFWSATAEQS